MGSGLPALLLVAGRCMASRVDVILQVFVIFAAAKAAGEVFVRLDLPAIAGELLVGILLGPHVAGLIEVNQTTETLAELGIVILLFTVGLETPVSGLIRVGRSSLITSVAGILAAGSTAVLVMVAFGFSLHEGLLVGTALAASSVGVAARVFQDVGLTASRQARVVLGASIVDDVATLALFPLDRKSTRLNSSQGSISYAVFCLKKKTGILAKLVGPGGAVKLVTACLAGGAAAACCVATGVIPDVGLPALGVFFF